MAITFVDGYNFTVVNALEAKLFLSALAWCLGADNVPETEELPEFMREGFLADDDAFLNEPRVKIHNACCDCKSVDDPKRKLHIYHMAEFNTQALRYYRTPLNMLQHCSNVRGRDEYYIYVPYSHEARSFYTYPELQEALAPWLRDESLAFMVLSLGDWIQNYACSFGDMERFRPAIRDIARALPTKDMIIVHRVEQAILDARKARMEEDSNYF